MAKALNVEVAIRDIQKQIDDAHVETDNCDNQTRRSLYSDVELIRLDLEADLSIGDEKRKELNQLLDFLGNRLSLQSLRRPRHWWRHLDLAYRFIGLTALFITSGIFFSLPIIALSAVDSLLIRLEIISPRHKLSEIAKVWLVGKAFILISGVSVTIDGLDQKPFDHSCVILTFSHASSLDGFIIASTCPVPHYALAKKELFLIPFFSWISLAIGGVPVDR